MLSAAALALLAPLAVLADDVKTAPPGTPVTITVTQAGPSAPTVTLTLGPRQAQAVPSKGCCAHSGGGNIDVQSPSSDTVIITLTGAAVACCCHAGFDFTVDQCFEVVFEKSEVKQAKVTLEGRVIGLLRGKGLGGCATVGEGHASLTCGSIALASISTPAHSVCGCQNLSINDHEGPCTSPIAPGKYHLHISWHLDASTKLMPCKPSAEFAPDPAIDPLWISYKEPFHGAAKKDFGLQVTLKVAEETAPANGDKKEEGKEKLPPPVPDPMKTPMKEKLPPPVADPEKKVS
jgi:hypothetical protein